MAEVIWHDEELKKTIKKGTRKALAASGRIVKSRARRLAPVGEVSRPAPPGGPAWKARVPGTLKISVRYKLVKKGTKVQVIAGARSKKKLTPYYAMWVEYGTAKMAAKPFIRPALAASLGDIMSQFHDWI